MRREKNLTDNITTSWPHLASRDLKEFQLSWNFKIGPCLAINICQERFCDYISIRSRVRHFGQNMSLFGSYKRGIL